MDECKPLVGAHAPLWWWDAREAKGAAAAAAAAGPLAAKPPADACASHGVSSRGGGRSWRSGLAGPLLDLLAGRPVPDLFLEKLQSG